MERNYNYGLCNWRGLRYQRYQNCTVSGRRHRYGKCDGRISHVSAEKRLRRTGSGRLESCNDPNHSDRCHQKWCGKRGDQGHWHFRTDAWSGHAGQGKSGSAEVDHLVRPAYCRRGRGNEPCCRSGKADGDHCQSGTDRLDCRKDPVGTEQRTGRI